MKNKKGFTLIELLAVIVVLAIVMVLATTTVLPYMGQAREKAFRIEATNVIESAESAVDIYNLGELTINGDTSSCKTNTSICFTVENLIDNALYSGSKEEYSGKVEINLTDEKNPSYTLYFKKNDEFKIIAGIVKNYNENGIISVEAWDDEYALCNCE